MNSENESRDIKNTKTLLATKHLTISELSNLPSDKIPELLSSPTQYPEKATELSLAQRTYAAQAYLLKYFKSRSNTPDSPKQTNKLEHIAPSQLLFRPVLAASSEVTNSNEHYNTTNQIQHPDNFSQHPTTLTPLSQQSHKSSPTNNQCNLKKEQQMTQNPQFLHAAQNPDSNAETQLANTFEIPLITTQHISQPEESFTQQQQTFQTSICTNSPDNLPWGDEMSPPDDNLLRLYSLNVNGFKIPKSDIFGGTFHEFCKTVLSAGVNVCCIQEINLDIQQPKIQNILHRTLAKHSNRGKLYMGHTPTPKFSSFYKPGGTAMILNDSPASRICSHRIDPWGRWIVIVLKGRGDLKLAITTVYQPHKASWQSTAGSNTIVAQQYILIRQLHSNSTITPREKFQSDFLQEIELIRTTITPHLLIVGDFNEQFPSPFLTKLMDNGNLHHLPTICHPQTPLPTSYFRGQKCIDHAFGTQKFIDSLRSCGYEPFSLRHHSDHRALFLDFDITKLFQVNPYNTPRNPPRRLQSQSTPKVAKYLEFKHKYLSDHNFFSRLACLGVNQPCDRLAEKLDKTLTQASLAAEASIHLFPEPLWSVTLTSARLRVTYYKMRLSELKYNRDLQFSLQSLLAKLQHPPTQVSSVAECSKLLRQSRTQLKSAIRNQRQHREQEFQDKLARLALVGDADSKKLIKILRNIQKAEDTKKMFLKLRTATQKTKDTTITQLKVPRDPTHDPKNCVDWITLDVPDEIIEALQHRNAQHFHQAHGSPFTIPPLSESLHYTSAKGRHTMDILGGFYDSSKLPPNTQHILERISQIYHKSLNHPQLPSQITLSEMVSKLKIWPEQTSTSPSGIHLGHYKALIKHLSPPIDSDKATKDRYQEIKNKQRQILEAHHQLLNYALQTGYSYNRWQTTSSSILRKDPNDFRIHRLRVIHIFEADYNLFLAIKWRQLLQRAEMLTLINSGQFGSRPNRNAHDPVFMEVFQRQISQTTRTTLIQLNFDASSCYDRIIPSLAGLSSMAMGMTANNVAANTTTLQKARYHLKQGHKIHPSFYSHNNPHEIYGSGQGSGNSPFLWCIQSSILFDCYADKCFGATYSSPDRKENLTIGMIGFVDDSNGQVNSMLEPTANTQILLTKADHDAQLWNSLLQASGGALEPSKCSFHLLQWEFTSNASPKLTQTFHPEILNHLSQLTLLSTFKFLTTAQSHKTLGTQQTPNGETLTQFSELTQKAEYYRSVIERSAFTREEAHTFYHAILIPSMTYVLPTATLTKAQLRKIQSKCTVPLIPKLGFNRNTSRAVLYAPSSMGGLALRDFYIHQGSAQAQAFIKYWRGSNEIGTLLRIMTKWVHHSLGISKFFLEEVSVDLPHLEADWAKSLRQFLSSYTMTIKLQNNESVIPPLARVNDLFIMDHVLDSGNFSRKQIKMINYCRLYLNATLLSDITDLSGTTILQPDILWTQEFKTARRYIPIHQQKPPPRAWKLWEQVTTQLTSNRRRLRIPLKEWIVSPQRQSTIYRYYTNGQFLFIRQLPISHNPNFLSYRRISASAFSTVASTTCKFSLLPSNATPTEVTTRQFMYELKNQTYHPATVPTPPPQSWKEDKEVPTLIQAKPLWVQMLSHNNTSLHVSSDASVNEAKGAFGWLIAHPDVGTMVVGKGRVPGTNMSSYRAEAWGVLSVLRFLDRITRLNLFDFTTVSWFLECDNLALVKNLNKMEQSVKFPNYPGPNAPAPEAQMSAHHYIKFLQANPLTSDWDILISIFHLSYLFKSCQVRHIKGHQDRNTQKASLDFSARLNIRCDVIASQAQLLPAFATNHSLPDAAIYLYINSTQITSRWPAAIRYHCASKDYQTYLCHKYNWNAHTWHSINWESFSNSIRKQTQHKTHFIKMVNECLPTNSRQFRCGHVSNPTCPLCYIHVETFQHLFQCKSLISTQWRQKFHKTIRSQLSSLNTDPILTTILLQFFSELCGEDRQPSTSETPQEYRKLQESQEQIGSQQLWLGRFSVEWDNIQSQYRASFLGETRPTNGSWTSEIIQTIWSEWLQLWTARNQAIHGSNPLESRTLLRKSLLQELQKIIQQRHQVEPSLRASVPISINDPDRWTTTRISSWFTMYKDSVSQSISTFAHRCVNGIRTLQHYFPRRSVHHEGAYYQDSHAPPWVGGLRPPPTSPTSGAENPN